MKIVLGSLFPFYSVTKRTKSGIQRLPLVALKTVLPEVTAGQGVRNLGKRAVMSHLVIVRNL